MSEASEAASYGLEPLASLPVFFRLDGRTVAMAGATPPAVWKAELLAAAGATVRVFDEAPSGAMLALAGRLPQDRLVLVGRRWTEHDLAGAALAIGAIEDDQEAERFREAAHAAGVPVNVIDRPAFCDFQFGTLLARSPLIIGISTDGAAPVFGQALRARIEAVLPADLGRWAVAAKAWRPLVQARGLAFRARRRFWEVFAESALAGEAEPSAAVLEACFAAASAEAGPGTPGRLTLVGAGQGTVAAVTLGAIAALQAADIVIHDPDVSRAVIGLARREADKRPALEATPAEAVAWARDKVVVWLGTGDPGTCARWAQRRAEMAAQGGEVVTVAASSTCPSCPTGCRFRSSA